MSETYTTVGGDTLTSIAERMGHPGEWQALALANVDQVGDDVPDEAKMHVVAERAQFPGSELAMPAEWAAAPERETKPAPKAEASDEDKAEVEDAARAAEDFERRQQRKR